MPWQLIYTSAPRGLVSGQSGFCTVARSPDLREALVQRLEQISSYHYLRLSEAATANRNPAISAFRLLDLRGAKYHVLTRILPCGLDFTARTNHLAHHLVFQTEELAPLPSPAAILRHWPGWIKAWQGEPRLLDDIPAAAFASPAKSFLPAQTWLRLTGDAGKAAGLLESECIRGCYLVCPPGSEETVLEMFCETLQLLNLTGQFPLRPWRHPFTTFMQAEDNPADFQWRACQEGAPACQQAVQRSAPLLALASVRAPANSLAKTAREGLKPSEPSQSMPPSRSLPSIRKTPIPRPPPVPSQPAFKSRRSSRFSLIGVYAEMKLRLSMMQQWFSNQSAASRASICIFAAVLLGLMAIHAFHKAPPPPTPVVAVPTPHSPEPSLLPSRRSSQTASSQPVPIRAQLPDPRQLDWLSGEGQTFVFVTSNLSLFDLPVDRIAPFVRLIHGFDQLQTLPTNIQLSLKTNIWDSQPGEPMSVNPRRTQELSARAASGLECSFNYANTNPVAVKTTFPAPPGAFSVQFRFSSPTNGGPFQLFILNESHPPAPVRMSMRWLNPNGASLAASLPQPLRERLLGKFTLLQGQIWQFRPFIRSGRQTNWLYENWPPEFLPREERELEFASVRNLLIGQENLAGTIAGPAEEKLSEGRKLELYTNVADYQFGKDLGLKGPLTSFPDWTNTLPRTNALELPALFLAYLGELQKQAATNHDWTLDWRIPKMSDEAITVSNDFRSLYNSWIESVPAAKTNRDFSNDYFNTTWLKLNVLENFIRTQSLAEERQSKRDKLQKLLNLVPSSLEDKKTAYVGLFIVDPKPPRRGLELIRFETP